MWLQPRGGGLEWWASAFVVTTILVGTLLGNGGVLLGLRGGRRAYHYPLTSLVAADMLVGVAVQPLAAATELFVFKLNRYICGFWSTMDVLCCTASILSLCALAWERWYGITAPLARSKRARRSKFLAYCVWPASALVALPNALLTPPHHFDPGKLEKGCPVNVNTGYVFFSISLSFYLPAALLVVMYGCILRALAAPPPIRAHRGRSPAVNTANLVERSNSNDTGNSEDINMNVLGTTNGGPAAQKCTSHEAFIRRQRRATRTIVILMALFLVCWTPYFIILPLDSLCHCVNPSTWLWCTWLGYANSALNPLVYAAAFRGGGRQRSSTMSSSR
ncbi:octopamine receptor-like [Aricia agestis]|uniref:octopamine receptor-like n=1 Tax=Aricia agestis TaxID=91739 RepID=UPI001C202EE9|nr:octopamine receptor-like [Aricia agestis]